jgi:hypothetical protein
LAGSSEGPTAAAAAGGAAAPETCTAGDDAARDGGSTKQSVGGSSARKDEETDVEALLQRAGFIERLTDVAYLIRQGQQGHSLISS